MLFKTREKEICYRDCPKEVFDQLAKLCAADAKYETVSLYYEGDACKGKLSIIVNPYSDLVYKRICMESAIIISNHLNE